MQKFNILGFFQRCNFLNQNSPKFFFTIQKIFLRLINWSKQDPNVLRNQAGLAKNYLNRLLNYHFIPTLRIISWRIVVQTLANNYRTISSKTVLCKPGHKPQSSDRSIFSEHPVFNRLPYLKLYVGVGVVRGLSHDPEGSTRVVVVGAIITCSQWNKCSDRSMEV